MAENIFENNKKQPEEVKKGEQYSLLKDERLDKDDAQDVANMMRSVLKEVGFEDNEISAEDYSKAEMVVEDIIEKAKSESDSEKFQKYIASIVFIPTFGVLESAILAFVTIKEYLNNKLGNTTDEVHKKNMQIALDSFKDSFQMIQSDEKKLETLKKYGKWIDKNMIENSKIF